MIKSLDNHKTPTRSPTIFDQKTRPNSPFISPINSIIKRSHSTSSLNTSSGSSTPNLFPKTSTCKSNPQKTDNKLKKENEELKQKLSCLLETQNDQSKLMNKTLDDYYEAYAIIRRDRVIFTIIAVSLVYFSFNQIWKK